MVYGTSGRILFVCAGNTCRSPMAAALAASAFPQATVESAGCFPGFGVAENAVLVVTEVTGVDISGHRPRDVAEVDLADFDLIVVLDNDVAKELPVIPSGVTQLVRHVRDPYGSSLEVYRQCAVDLGTLIEELARDGW
jgi:protein-tyrosine-phosphatase